MRNSLIFILFIFGCQRTDIKQNFSVEYFYVNYDIENSFLVNTDTTKVEFFNAKKDSIETLTYIYNQENNNDTVKIYLKQSQDYQPKYFTNGLEKDNYYFVFEDSKKYIINGNNYEVFKYSKNPLIIDGCISYFWVPNFGIILKRSSTWETYQKLQTNDLQLNNNLNLLEEVILSDTKFSSGCFINSIYKPDSDIQIKILD
ncbi:hypothetical protein MY04_5503 [Flammeovirga sp. MY04]|uniref:hypothetical protein n=1 Tax=Flammeovirga sp. MY04 TaxID=1191459 RepID=UPI000806379A|nr:hypothetical protein [Flammeovirga sp. MY04]ANQ52834.1 hypothetical protein MY04_5503 [Flammeovirga sp. MY04]